MKKVSGLLVVMMAALVVSMLAQEASAAGRWFSRRPAATCANGTCRPTTYTTTQRTTVSVTTEVSTAQGVANIMARLGRVGHFGGNRGYEGCGCGPTPQAAYSICCFANSGMATVDVGYAQAANGMWYCCRRYR